MTATDWADLARFGVLTLFAWNLGLTTLILRIYYRTWADNGRKGLLPAHVTAISVSYLVLMAEAAWNNVARLNQPPTAYIPVNFLGFGLGFLALQIVLRYEQRRRDWLSCQRRRATD